jgi:hypothetical protein|tara:strand:+ start:8268 stop:9977 length:1710 start_codon:yes stop_codon:yes gene_type:complete
MSEQYTEEEQAVIDSILGKDTPKQDVSWGGYEFKLPNKNRPTTFNTELFNEFLSIFFLGEDQFVRQFSRDVIDFLGRRESGQLEQEDLQVPDVSLAQYHLWAEAQFGVPFDELPPNVKDNINFIYQSLSYDTPAVKEAATIISEGTDVLIDLHQKGILPEGLDHLSDDIVGTAISSGYTDQADLAYKAYINKQSYDVNYITEAAMAIDLDSAEELMDKLDKNEITAEAYLAGLDAIIDKEYGEDYVQKFIDEGFAITEGALFGPGIEMTPEEAEQARARTYFGEQDYYGIGQLDLDVYSEATSQGTMPLYQSGLATSLFANASAEDIMDTQLLLVESGFLQPFTFVYGVLDNNPGGTIDAIESAMSRFNLNGDGMTMEDLYSILLAPGSTAANMNVFLKEFFKDSLADYGYGTGAFEPNYGGENAYQNIFNYTKPNFTNASSYISSAIQDGLGRPASDGELQEFFDFWSKQDYSLQKQNFEIRQKNMQIQLEDARRRRGLAGQGRVGDFEPTALEAEIDIPSAMATSFDNFMRDTYGDLIAGSQADAAYRKSFANIMASLAAIGNQSGN